VELGEAVYWSRSRKKLWHKGEESGHVQKVLEIRLDCDEDVVLLKIEQAGGIACHTGRHSCFFQKFEGDAQEGDWQNTEPVLKDPTTSTRQANEHHPDRLADVIESRKPANGGDPATSYTSKLFAKGDDAILKKIGEEATETVMAAKDARAGGDSGKVLYEVADLWFHTLVLLAQFDLKPQQVLDELARREGVSGIEEKASRKE
jgi:phosphoribosyl-ATP pyrophosphohydrolase